MKIKNLNREKPASKLFYLLGLFMAMWILPQNTFAHCDSYDGPVVQEALKALEENNVKLVLKWVEEKHEKEIKLLFKKTVKYKKDPEVYPLLEKHFLETLVRLHREGEGEPYSGLKPAGSTSKIITMTDTALREKDIDSFLSKLNDHIERVVREKYQKVAALHLVKNQSVEKGREYVAAYVDYTHTIEALHVILEHSDGGHGAHH
ncbi:MAG TPA: DUF6448 family protein [Flavobacteriaceae bacterium]|nr:DUF6448 family protein [Flavobacteriaceae bacterium]